MTGRINFKDLAFYIGFRWVVIDVRYIVDKLYTGIRQINDNMGKIMSMLLLSYLIFLIKRTQYAYKFT